MLPKRRTKPRPNFSRLVGVGARERRETRVAARREKGAHLRPPGVAKIEAGGVASTLDPLGLPR